jgi:hypothetical protein
MFSCDPAAYEQHHEVFGASDAVDSAAHLFCFRFTPSIAPHRSGAGCTRRTKQNGCHLQVIENTIKKGGEMPRAAVNRANSVNLVNSASRSLGNP